MHSHIHITICLVTLTECWTYFDFTHLHQLKYYHCFPDPCKDYKCQNGGTCMKYEHCGEPECTCPSGFIGDKCETTGIVRCYLII